MNQMSKYEQECAKNTHCRMLPSTQTKLISLSCDTAWKLAQSCITIWCRKTKMALRTPYTNSFLRWTHYHSVQSCEECKATVIVLYSSCFRVTNLQNNLRKCLFCLNFYWSLAGVSGMLVRSHIRLTNIQTTLKTCHFHKYVCVPSSTQCVPRVPSARRKRTPISKLCIGFSELNDNTPAAMNPLFIYLFSVLL